MEENKNKRVIRLCRLSERIGWSNEVILHRLKEAGFSLPTNNPNIFLDNSHIQILAGEYVKAVKDFQTRNAAKSNQLSSKELYRIRRFLRRFVAKDFSSDELLYLTEINKDTLVEAMSKPSGSPPSQYESLFSHARTYICDPEPDELWVKLDETRIHEFFLDVIYGFSFESSSGSLVDIQIRIKQTFNDNRKRIFSLLFSNRYHIFSSDEDHSSGVLLPYNSSVKFAFRGVLINLIIYFKQLITWKFQQNKLSLSI